MPFTLAHSAAAIPLYFVDRKRLSLSALVIGSLAPDFEYFIRLKPVSVFSHTIGGLFYFCLPVSFLVLVVLHCLWKRPITLMLSSRLRNRLWPYCGVYRFRQRAKWIVVSILLGAASHIVWDSFTHQYGYVVKACPFLRETAFCLASVNVGWYKLLQHGSTLLGFVVIMAACWLWLREGDAIKVDVPSPFSVRMRIFFATIVLSVTLVSGIAAAFVTVGWPASLGGMPVFIGRFIVAAIPALFVSITIGCATIRVLGRYQRELISEEGCSMIE